MITPQDGAAPAPTPRELRELAYAQRIAVYGVKKFVPDLKTWQPLDTMMGVLSQIDNLLAGTPAPQESPRPTTGAATIGECSPAHLDDLAVSAGLLLKMKTLTALADLYRYAILQCEEKDGQYGTRERERQARQALMDALNPTPAAPWTTGEFTQQIAFYSMLMAWTPDECREFYTMLSRRPDFNPADRSSVESFAEIAECLKPIAEYYKMLDHLKLKDWLHSIGDKPLTKGMIHNVVAAHAHALRAANGGEQTKTGPAASEAGR